MVACYARGRDHSPNHATRSFVPTGTKAISSLQSFCGLGISLWAELAHLRSTAVCGPARTVVWRGCPATGILTRFLALRRARAQLRGARARNRRTDYTHSMIPRHHRISSPSESTSRQFEPVWISIPDPFPDSCHRKQQTNLESQLTLKSNHVQYQETSLDLLSYVLHYPRQC